MDPSSIKLLKDHKNLVLLMAKSNKSSETRVQVLFRAICDIEARERVGLARAVAWLVWIVSGD